MVSAAKAAVTKKMATKKIPTAVVKRRASQAAYKGPSVMTLHRFVVPTSFGPFSVLTDADGAVRLCDWRADEASKLQVMQARWYKGTTLRVVEGNAAKASTNDEDKDVLIQDAALAKGEAAAMHLDRFFNPPSATAATPAALQRELDAIPIVMPPTAGPYTAKVWQTLRDRVKAGACLSYKQLGELVQKEAQGKSTTTMATAASGKTKAVPSRAVGQAMACNPIPIIVPCHRVLGSTEGLHGYGCGLEKKVWLLRHEKAPVSNKKLTPVERETRVCTKESCK